MEYEEIRVDDDRHVRLITLERPARRNAMSWRMLAELADAMASADEVLPAALEYARKIARECSPTSCGIVKELLWSALDLDQAETRRIELALFGWVGRRADATEGVLSWSERRPPVWMGAPSDRPRWWPTPPR